MSILDRIPLVQILNFQTSLFVMTCNFSWSTAQCQQLFPILLSVRKSNWNSNQELIWVQLNVINIMVWT